jgi:hypothetical protein
MQMRRHKQIIISAKIISPSVTFKKWGVQNRAVGVGMRYVVLCNRLLIHHGERLDLVL